MKTLLIIGHIFPEPTTTAAGTRMMQLISLFEKDEQIAEVFNQKFIRTIAAIRRVEYQAYLKVISSWEREYLLLNV